MTLIEKKVAALNTAAMRASTAVSTLNEAQAQVDPEVLSGFHDTIEAAINGTLWTEDDSVFATYLTGAMSRLRQGVTPALTFSAREGKLMEGGQHYDTTFTLSPEDNETLTITLGVFVQADESEADISERTPVTLSMSEATLSNDDKDLLVALAYEFIVHAAWHCAPVDAQAIKQANATLKALGPLLDMAWDQTTPASK